MKDVSRRHFMCGSASLALLPAMVGIETGRLPAVTAGEARSSVHYELDRLVECSVRFREIEHRELANAKDLRAWQTRYDDLVGAADAVRHAITDAMPERDRLIRQAKAFVEPSCMRAVLWWCPVDGMSPAYGQEASRYFAARSQWACSIAQLPDDKGQPILTGFAALTAIQRMVPATSGDRLALKRVIESLNNDDMVDVSIARSNLESHEVRDFRSWARPCGSFTCHNCEAWLAAYEEDA